MHIDNNPMFRKIPVPWYDSNVICIVAASLALAVSLFSIIGMHVGLTYSYIPIIWIPVLLCVLSTSVFISLVIRLARRWKTR